MYVLAFNCITYVQIGDEGLIQWRDVKKTLILNETANLIWTMLSARASPNEISAAISRTFDVDELTARHDLGDFIEFLYGEGLLSEDNFSQT